MISKIKKLKKIDKQSVVIDDFLLNKEGNLEIYYAPFDYINSKAKIVIVGITPGLQQMIQSFQVIKEGKSLKEVKDLSIIAEMIQTIINIILEVRTIRVREKTVLLY